MQLQEGCRISNIKDLINSVQSSLKSHTLWVTLYMHTRTHIPRLWFKYKILFKATYLEGRQYVFIFLSLGPRTLISPATSSNLANLSSSSVKFFRSSKPSQTYIQYIRLRFNKTTKHTPASINLIFHKSINQLINQTINQ